MKHRIAAGMMVVVAGLALGGCGTLSAPAVSPGTPAAEVQNKYGKPTDVRTVGGAPAWDYVTGPEGFQTWRVNLDGANRVRSVEPLLTERRFIALKQGASRADVETMFGRPLQVSKFPRLDAEVWTYRYKDLTMEMLADVYMSMRDGTVRYTSLYRDPAFTNSFAN
jgi:outer membrane protein assembly factor BamE (lipoprotein component of BamABCDE complex)